MVKTGKNGENIKENPPSPAAPQPPAPRCCPVGKLRPKTPTNSHSRAAKAGQHLRPYLAHFPLIFLRFSPVVPALVRGGRKARRDGERTAKDGRETAEKRPGQTGEAHLADEWQPQPPPPPPLPSPQRSRSSTRCRCCPHRRTATRAVSGKETAEPERVDGGYGSTKRARRERQREGAAWKGRTG